MRGFEEIDAIEAQYLSRTPGSEPQLWKSYDLLLDRWKGGTRDRETALRLLFLAWFSYAEANWLTGLRGAPIDLFRELYQFLDVESTDDEELCFVLRVMINVRDDFLCSDWDLSRLSDRVLERLENREFRVTPEQFEGRGVFGEYFAHQVRGGSAHAPKPPPAPKIILPGRSDA